jgi:hypothetical protein
MTLAEVREVIDLREFPAPVGATRSSSNAGQASFSAPLGETTTVATAFEHYAGRLLAADWKPLPYDGEVQPTEESAFAAFTKGGLIASLSVGVSLAPPDGKDVNAGLFLGGNVDARSLPRPEDAAPVSESPTSVCYTTASSINEVRKLLSQRLAPQGWVEHRAPDLPGYKTPLEVLRRSQSFLAGCVLISVHYSEEAGKTRAILGTSVVPATAPIPAGAQDVQFAPSPLYLYCAVARPIEEVRDSYERAMRDEGWRATEVTPSDKERDLALRFEADGRTPLGLECLVDRGVVFLELRERP